MVSKNLKIGMVLKIKILSIFSDNSELKRISKTSLSLIKFEEMIDNISEEMFSIVHYFNFFEIKNSIL